MYTKKILASCTVIALQDTRFVYPCCSFCLSRSTEDSGLRSRCTKCGFTCDIQNVDYRYRLSVKVSRGRNIFGVTVFGGCLNSFFGIPAGGLQRFVDSGKPEGPQSVQQLLLKAVEDCFIGRTFVFGFKFSGTDAEWCLFDEHTSSLGLGGASPQFVACQLISANGAFVGMTVFGYLQNLLKASSSSSPSATDTAVCQKDSLVDSCEHTLPLCVRSYSQTSSAGLTQLWQPTSDMDLCFSTEEAGGHCLPEMAVDDAECVSSQNVHGPVLKANPEWPTKEHSSVDQVKSLNNVQYASNMCHTTNCHQFKRSFSNHWSSCTSLGTDADASFFFEKSYFSHSHQNASFVLDDAPLSETLGSFVRVEPQISHPANTGVLKPANKWNMHERDQATPKKMDCVHRPLHNIMGKANERLHKRMPRNRKILSLSKPYLPGTPKVSHVSKDSTLGIKDIVSNSLTKNPVNMPFCLQHDQKIKHIVQAAHAVYPEIQSRDMKEEESASSDNEDEYNYSADLFYQSSLDISIPDETDTAVTDRKDIRNKHMNISEGEVFSTVHFAPSLQSTPIAYPNRHDYYGQECGLGKKCSDLPCSKRHTTHTTGIKVLGKPCSARQEPRAVKSKLNQIQSNFLLENFDFDSGNFSSAGPSEEKEDLEHRYEDTNTNEWSRDLFDNQF